MHLSGAEKYLTGWNPEVRTVDLGSSRNASSKHWPERCITNRLTYTTLNGEVYFRLLFGTCRHCSYPTWQFGYYCWTYRITATLCARFLHLRETQAGLDVGSHSEVVVFPPCRMTSGTCSSLRKAYPLLGNVMNSPLPLNDVINGQGKLTHRLNSKW